MKNKNVLVKIYHPIWWLPALSWLYFAILVLIQIPVIMIITNIVVGRIESLPILLLIVIILMDLMMLWYLITYSLRTYIKVYEEGIELQRGGSYFFVTWKNLKVFGGRSRGKDVEFGVYLHEMSKPEVKGFIETILFGQESDFFPVTKVILLPRRWDQASRTVTIDTNKLLETEFGKDLYHFAPQLFEK